MKEVEKKDVPEISGGQWSDGTTEYVILPIVQEPELPDARIPTPEQRQTV